MSRRWVIVASERAARPTDFKHEQITLNDAATCPFCEGREDRTPPELFAVRAPGTAPNTPGWRVRVVSNKFPALRIEGETKQTEVGIFARMDGVGAHEVIIETTEHDTHLGLLPIEQVADVIRAYHERYVDLGRDHRFEYGLLFRNHGRSAGASLSHPHSQLIALPIVPKQAAEEVDAAESHFGRRGECIYCAMLAQEHTAAERIVFENAEFTVLEAYAARTPFETWVIPRGHQADFADLGPQMFVPLAQALHEALFRLHACLNNPPYNFMIHSLPYRSQLHHAYHWHIEITPQLTHVAGFEWGSGFYINPVIPEHAARYLREVQVPKSAPVPTPVARPGKP